MSNLLDALFGNAAIRRALFKSRFFLVLALLVPLAWAMDPAWLGPGFAISMLGQLIQTWCFAALVKNRELTVRGPYVLSRNPMYVGRYFLILGFVLLLANAWVVVGYTAAYGLYMVQRVKREETRLARVFGTRYANYSSEVPRFVPALGRLGERTLWYWDWGTFAENHAHWNIVGTLAAYAALWAMRRTLFA